MQLTKDYQQDSFTPKTRIKRNFLTSEDDENQEIVLFMSDPQWRNGYMLFAHALRDMDDKIVVLQMATVVRDCEILFLITFDELIQLSEMFQQPISNAVDSISADEETVTTDLDGTGCAIDECGDDEHREERATVARRNKGTNYASVMQLLLK